MFKPIVMIIPLCFVLKVVTGTEASEKSFRFTYLESSLITSPGPLRIIVQPTDQSDCKGNKVTYSILAEGGTGTIHYQWRRKRIVDAGFASFGARDSIKLPVYNIGTGLEAPDQTQYQVIVTDQDSTITSTIASLLVNQITGISPTGVATYNLNQGDNVAFRVLYSGNSPLSFQWIKKYGMNDWRDLSDNSRISGSKSAQLTLKKIALADSGIYKVRVDFPTLNGNQCTETSSISRKISVSPVVDTEPPTFINPDAGLFHFCPDDLELANWNESISNILPSEKSVYHFQKNNTAFDLPVTNFTDNITPSEDLILHWEIFESDNQLTAVKDNSGILLNDIIGQISLHTQNIDFENSTDSNRIFQIIFWLEDAAGNLTPETSRYKIVVEILPRPVILSNF